MIKIAVCDDENMFALSFKTKLRDGFRKVLKQEIIVDTFDDANALLYKMKNTAYDVVFLDIEMPGVNGLEAAGWIKKNSARAFIVFTTNRDDLVFDALRIKPLGFLRKSHLAQELDGMIDYITETVNFSDAKVSIKCKEGVVNLNLADVFYLENAGNSVFFVTKDRKYEPRDSLYKKEQELEQFGFIRSHGSFIINLNHIYKVKTKEIVLDNGSTVPLSRSRHRILKERFLKEMVINNECNNFNCI